MKLIDYMEVHRVGPSEMARRLKVNHATVIRYRDGMRIPGPDVMRRIVDVTDGAVTPNDFFDLTPHPEGQSPPAAS